MILGGGHAPREREYLFVDGGCLRASVRKICQDLFGDAIAYQPYVPAMASGAYDKIFFYDAVPGKARMEKPRARMKLVCSQTTIALRKFRRWIVSTLHLGKS